MSKFSKSLDRIDTFSDPDYQSMLEEYSKSTVFLESSSKSNVIISSNIQNVPPLTNPLLEEEHELLDEETVNWRRLFTRAFAFFLLFLIIIFLSLGGISKKFLALAGFVCILLILIIVNTYIKLIHYLPCYSYCKKEDTEEDDPLRKSITGINTIFGFKFHHSKNKDANDIENSSYVPPSINPMIYGKEPDIDL